MFKVKRVTSWNVSIDRLADTTEFYREIMGAEQIHPPVTEDRPGGGRVVITRLDLGGMSLGLFEWADGLRPDWTHHTFEVEWPGEPDEVRKRLEARGVAVQSVRQHGEGGGYSISLRDPCGNRIELSTERAPLPNEIRPSS